MLSGWRPTFKKLHVLTTIIIICLLVLSCSIIVNAQQLTVRTRARASYEFTLEFTTSKTTIEPNGDGVVELWLNNTGDYDDKYELAIHDVPTNWSAFFDNGETELKSVSVGGHNYDLVQVYVSAPTSGKITLKVTCTSKTNSNKITAEISIEAKKVLHIILKDPNNVHSIKASMNTTFELEIKNYQDSSNVVSLSIDMPHNTKWYAKLDNDSLTLAASEIKNVILTVIAPSSGNPGDKITLIIIAKPESTTQEFRSQDLIVMIPKIYNITYSLKQESELSFPNSTINYTLKLFNVGNIEDTISLALHENFNDWAIYFFKGEELFDPAQDSFYLEVNDFIEFLLQVKIPLHATADAHKIVYGIYSKEKGGANPINNLVIITQVQLISNIEINIPIGSSPIVDLAKVTYYEFIVHNKGNGKDTMTISIPVVSIPAEWDISFYSVKNTEDTNTTEPVDFTTPFEIDIFEPIEYLPEISEGKSYYNISLVLAANQLAYIILSITPPNKGKPGTETFTIYGESSSGNIDTVTKSITLTLRVSDLSISGLSLDPQVPTINEKVKVTFNIKNNYHLLATNFYVKLVEINGVLITDLGSVQISNLNPNETREISFYWMPKEVREMGYILKAELGGSIIPKDNSTPYRTLNVFVNEEPTTKKSTNDVIIIISVIVIIFLVLLLIFSLRYQKKQRMAMEVSEQDSKERLRTRDKPAKKSSTSKTKSESAKQRSKGSSSRSVEYSRKGGRRNDF